MLKVLRDTIQIYPEFDEDIAGDDGVY